MKNIALIGKGYWGTKIAESINRNKHFNLCYHIGSESRKTILKDKNIEAVFVMTPIGTHFDIAKECLLNNKHVYSAKPLGTVPGQIEELISIAEWKDLKISVDYTPMFSAELVAVQKAIISLGGIVLMSMCNFGTAESNKHNIYWLYASHLLALLSKFKDLKVLNFAFQDIAVKNPEIITFDCGSIFVSKLMDHRELGIAFSCKHGKVLYRPMSYLAISIKEDGKITQYRKRSNISGIDMSIKHFHNVLTGKEESNIKIASLVTNIISPNV